jgi:hypothetical protein
MPLRVKFLSKAASGNSASYLRRHMPNGECLLGEIEWVFQQDDSRDDWLVVYDDLPSVAGERNTLWEEKLSCPRENTLLITAEPSTIKVYGKAFLAQFGHVLTSQEPWAIPHPNPIFAQCGLLWFYGKSHKQASADFPTLKSFNFSTVCSSKQQRHTLHSLRHEFTSRLKNEIPELEVFGHGHRFIQSKIEALDPFRYHLAIENHHAPRKNSLTPFSAAACPFTSAARIFLNTSPKKASFIWTSVISTVALKSSGKAFETKLTKKGYPPSERQDASYWKNMRCFPCSPT